MRNLQNKYKKNNNQYSIENQILYEDNHIIIINKRSSQIVHADKTNDESLDCIVKNYLRNKYNKPGNVFCGVVHRLDRPVSGAVIFAKTSKSLSRLNNMLRNHEIKKIYWAIVRCNPPNNEGTLKNYIARNENNNKSYITNDSNKGLYAELHYKIIAKSEFYTLLQVNLSTGRHHQIRVQLANIGCPIKGDLKYGFGRSNKIASISLHARQLSFIHPVNKQEINIIAPCPNENLWQFFENTVEEIDA